MSRRYLIETDGKHAFYTQARNRGANPRLENFSPPCKNVMDIVQIYKKFGPLSENSSSSLVSQAGYGPVCTSNRLL